MQLGKNTQYIINLLPAKHKISGLKKSGILTSAVIINIPVKNLHHDVDYLENISVLVYKQCE
jgi:hypothetical protein